jgi:DNA polymerase V
MQPGRPYNRAGILLTGLTAAAAVVPLLPRGADPALGRTLDAVTSKFGTGALGYGVSGLRQPRAWAMRRELLSPAATTRWDQLLPVHARR